MCFIYYSWSTRRAWMSYKYLMYNGGVVSVSDGRRLRQAVNAEDYDLGIQHAK